MLWRLGLLFGVCLVLARCEDEEVIKCAGGECVKLHLCPNNEYNIDGANIIDIRFNPDNECEDYLLKCCPYPEDDDEIVIPPPTSNPGTGPVTGPGTNAGPVTGTVEPGAGSGTGSVPPVQGTGPVQPVPGGAGQLGTGNKPTGGAGGGKPYGHGPGQGQGHGYGSCEGSCSKPDSSSASDEQTVLVGANQLSGGGIGNSANQVKDQSQISQVQQGGGPPVGGTSAKPGSPGTGTSGPNQPSVGSGTVNPTGAGTGQQPGGTGGSPGSQKPNQGRPGASGEAGNQAQQSVEKPGGAGTTGGAPNQQSGQQGSGGSPGVGGAGPTHNPNQQGTGGTGGPGVGGGSPTTGGSGGYGITGATPTPKPNQQGVPGAGGNTSPSQSGVIGPNNPGTGIPPGKQQEGGAGQPHPGLGGVKNPGAGDKLGAVTQNPLDKTVDVPQQCGLRNADGVGFRITGDNDGESEYGEFPWMVAILKEEKALDQVINVYQCGGSLIHPSVVLTAAHCVQNRKTEELKARLGEWDTQTKNEMFDYQDRNVVEVVSHAEFYKGGLFNDVALLFLDHPAEIMETVNTICLPPANHNFDLSRCFASGWGKDVFGKQGTYQVILKKIELPIMPYEQCQTALRTTRLGRRFKLHKSFICAGGEKGRDTCKGDGGSPLVCPIPGTVNQYYQAGMVAWGIGCGEDGIPGVYVNVPMFREWIDDHLRQRNITDSFYLHS
ncbi:uncharacterized PE-PGRS family protein PE_PGRS54-like isoform X2 [Anopheles funestus]|uniref:uncharacterized PE-PGRS family protein PE_PGRS54-like isoform X2 n=1 Tax=Anopheles funestus TaxID=62324 RepID=UPI0020C71BBE|nr:uncharacterized PE-PGRS family protein PE_PGRS54-like isoform X2 [Anopheles funestus]